MPDWHVHFHGRLDEDARARVASVASFRASTGTGTGPAAVLPEVDSHTLVVPAATAEDALATVQRALKGHDGPFSDFSATASSARDEQRERFLARYAGCPKCHTIVEPMSPSSAEDKRLHARCSREGCEMSFLVRDNEQELWRPLEVDPE